MTAKAVIPNVGNVSSRAAQAKTVVTVESPIYSIKAHIVLVLFAAVAIAGSGNAADSRNADSLASAPSIQAQHLPDAVASGKAARIGQVAGSQRLKLAIALPTRNQAELDQFLHDLQDPQSPAFHKYLTVDEYTARFGATQADYDAVIAWARTNGFDIAGTTPNRRLVNIEGDADTINRAFSVTMTEYQHPSEDRTFYSPDREPTTTGLGVPLLQISGLSNFTIPHLHLRKGNALVANATGSGPSGEFLPSDMRAAYYGSGPLTGAGQSIGILSFDGYQTGDVQLYYSNTGMSSSVPIHNVLVNGYSGACVTINSNGTINTGVCDDREQILDIVNAIGMAPGISQILFYEVDPADASGDAKLLNQMATDNSAKVLSCSWSWGANQATDDSIFQQMATQGQTFVDAAGDSGAWGQGSSQTIAADYPSQSPYILQVGGTDLATNGAGGSWASETGWADGGGGWDPSEPIPSWQQIAGVINASNKGSTSYRNAPDVAMEANFDNPTVNNGQFLTGYGGTSFAAPRWAGFVALINQQSVANGKGTVGFFNPMLYSLGAGSNYSSNFHDITSGSNPAINSKQQVISGGPSFNAVTRYDLVTGWGSPTAAFVTALASIGGSADFSLSDSPGSLTLNQGANGAATVTVTDLNGFSGSVALSASGLPGGVTASFNPSNATSTSTLTFTAASTAATGSATVTITGTSGSLSHATTLSLTVSPSRSLYIPLNPARLLDTRAGSTTIDGIDQAAGPIAAYSIFRMPVSGRDSIPSGLVAVVLNVTAVDPDGPGYLTVWSGTGGVPNASNLNLNAGYTIPNLVISSVDGGGEVAIYNGSSSAKNVVVDVQGYFPAGSAYVPITPPQRYLDTRSGYATVDGQDQGTGALPGGGQIDLSIAGRTTIPSSGVAAVVFNLTAVQPTGAGYVTAWPTGSSRPNASNLNLNPGMTIPNLVVSGLGSAGEVSLFSGGSAVTDLVADVQGWFPSNSGYTALTPARLLDTRSGQSTIDGAYAGQGAIASNGELDLQVTGRASVPAGAGAVVLNVTTVQPAQAGYVTVWPTGSAMPLASNLNLNAGTTIPNQVIAKIGNGGRVSIFNGSQGATDVVVDVEGWLPVAQ